MQLPRHDFNVSQQLMRFSVIQLEGNSMIVQVKLVHNNKDINNKVDQELERGRGVDDSISMYMRKIHPNMPNKSFEEYLRLAFFSLESMTSIVCLNYVPSNSFTVVFVTNLPSYRRDR